MLREKAKLNGKAVSDETRGSNETHDEMIAWQIIQWTAINNMGKGEPIYRSQDRETTPYVICSYALLQHSPCTSIDKD